MALRSSPESVWSRVVLGLIVSVILLAALGTWDRHRRSEQTERRQAERWSACFRDETKRMPAADAIDYCTIRYGPPKGR